MRLAGNVAHMKAKQNVYRVLEGKPEGLRPLRRSRHRWEEDSRMYLREI
jgi:hypothetical protein